MAAPTAPAVVLLVVQRDHGVAALPHALGQGIASVADAHTQRPHPDYAVELANRCGDARGEAIGVVDNAHRRLDPLAAKLRGEHLCHARAFQLRQVGRLFHHAVAHQPRHAHAHRRKRTIFAGSRQHLLAHRLNDAFGRHLHQRVLVVVRFRERAEASGQLVVHHQPRYDSLR